MDMIQEMQDNINKLNQESLLKAKIYETLTYQHYGMAIIVGAIIGELAQNDSELITRILATINSLENSQPKEAIFFASTFVEECFKSTQIKDASNISKQ